LDDVIKIINPPKLENKEEVENEEDQTIL
jgi:hypothetical protein